MTRKVRLVCIIIGLALLMSAAWVKHVGHQVPGIVLSLFGFLSLCGHLLWKNRPQSAKPPKQSD